MVMIYHSIFVYKNNEFLKELPGNYDFLFNQHINEQPIANSDSSNKINLKEKEENHLMQLKNSYPSFKNWAAQYPEDLGIIKRKIMKYVFSINNIIVDPKHLPIYLDYLAGDRKNSEQMKEFINEMDNYANNSLVIIAGGEAEGLVYNTFIDSGSIADKFKEQFAEKAIKGPLAIQEFELLVEKLGTRKYTPLSELRKVLVNPGELIARFELNYLNKSPKTI